MRTRAERRKNTIKFKKKHHPAADCGTAKCPICHPHKHIGGNHKDSVKAKYIQFTKKLIDNQIDLEPEIRHIISKKLYDML